MLRGRAMRCRLRSGGGTGPGYPAVVIELGSRERTRPAQVAVAWGSLKVVRHNPLLMATVWPLVLVAVFLPLSVRRCQRLSR